MNFVQIVDFDWLPCVIILYINCVVYCACGFVAMATLSFHRFLMGKVKVVLYFYLTLGILTKALQ